MPVIKLSVVDWAIQRNHLGRIQICFSIHSWIVGLNAIKALRKVLCEFFWYVVKDHAAFSHSHQSIAIISCNIKVVQIANDRNAHVFIYALQGIHDHLCIFGVKRSNRLVSQNNLRSLKQCTADGHTLLLKADRTVGLQSRPCQSGPMFPKHPVCLRRSTW